MFSTSQKCGNPFSIKGLNNEYTSLISFWNASVLLSYFLSNSSLSMTLFTNIMVWYLPFTLKSCNASSEENLIKLIILWAFSIGSLCTWANCSVASLCFSKEESIYAFLASIFFSSLQNLFTSNEIKSHKECWTDLRASLPSSLSLILSILSFFSSFDFSNWFFSWMSWEISFSF